MRLVLVLVSALLAGCNAGYYWHLARGHADLMSARVPVDEVLADPATDTVLREQLALSAKALVFARERLSLPSNGSYRDYVALDRDWVVWNLFAAPEFSLDAHQWCYPVAGCASYRGYFDRARAEQAADRLRARGFDVHGAGAIAYSTLGWFDDPLTPAMLARSDGGLVELLFHELVHQRFYLKGDTRFNESLATAVARHGRKAWFADRGADDDAAVAAAAWQSVRALLEQTRTALQTLYASDLPARQMRERKRAIQADTRARYHQALARQPALAAWQGFFDGPLNNAQLNTVADYNQWVPAFTSLIARCEAEWGCFWDAVDELAEMEDEARQAALQRLQDQERGHD